MKTERELEYYVHNFNNSEKFNDDVFESFTNKTNEIEYLQKHRAFIENNKLGFGDRAFHYMWLLLIRHLINNKFNLSLLEIGVYKEQIISLWNLIARQLGVYNIEITAITPLEGKTKPNFSLLNNIYAKLSKKFREDVKNGNFYENADYLSIIKSLYKHFDLDFKNTNIIKGYSEQIEVLKQVKNSKYSLIYIDGDHSYRGL